MKPIGSIVAMFVLVLAGALPAQRNELARRLAKLEQAWSLAPEGGEGRLRALPKVEEAVRAFFSFRLVQAARALDEARLLLGSETIEPARLWAAGRRVLLERRILDRRADEELVLRIDAFHVGGSEPEELSVTAELGPIGTAGTAGALRGRIDAEGGRLLLDHGDGDRDLVVRILSGSRELDRIVHAVAVISGFEARLDELEAEAEREDRPADWRQATLRSGLALLRGLRAGETPENEPRSFSLLESLEKIAALEDGAPLPAGEHLLALPRGKGADRLRISIPEGAGDESPLLLLVHGAGGSENMFFEAYGTGRYVAEALRRGAIVVAPRAPLFGRLDLEGLLARLQGVRPFAASKVFAVGHSMGAGLVVDQAMRKPGLFRTAVAIAGGRPVKDAVMLAKTPLLLGTADRDFGRGGVIALARQVRAIEGAEVELIERETSEHLLVVQDLIPSVFAFLASRGLPQL